MFVIHDFMVEQLHLSGNKLLFYALVYAYSCDEQGCYYGGKTYAANRLGCSRVSISKIAKELVNSGLLKVTQGIHDGHSCTDYVAIVPCPSVNFETCDDQKFTCKENLQGSVKKVYETCKESLHNNINNINNNIITKNTEHARKKDKIQFAEFVSMTEDEHRKLADEFGEADAKEMVDILNNYKGSTGKRYKSDYLAIRNWVIDRLFERKYRTRAGQSAMRSDVNGERPAVASMRAAVESFGRVAKKVNGQTLDDQ